ncbi:hypothetical protein AB4037_08645 [Labrys sp. KB_33_2]|uniref:hypothetical protein n=1 Tax=Labrys sp. KB_33_2 TaxID=3237479 RepID=UPI003F90D958
MSKLKKIVLQILLFWLAFCVARAAIDWHRFVSNPMETLYASLISGLVGGGTLAILNSIPNGRRDRK